jgi:hypothetical protein
MALTACRERKEGGQGVRTASCSGENLITSSGCSEASSALSRGLRWNRSGREVMLGMLSWTWEDEEDHRKMRNWSALEAYEVLHRNKFKTSST